MTSRPYQVVVWGTTGVVGRLVAEHIARDYQDVPLIVADASDQQSLLKLTESTKVVLATAGPFAVFGTPMLEACLATSTNYCDITGESNWVRKMIGEHDEEAKQKGIRVVNMAGFDSIPSDLGTFLVAEHMRRQHNRPIAKVEALFMDMKGALSGGTIVSLFGAGFDDKGPNRKAFTDPYGLDPPDSARGPDKGDSLAPGYSDAHKSWHVPFVMAPVNTKVVRRSNALRNQEYGKNFSYLEAQAVSGRIAAYIGSFVFVFFGALVSLKPVRTLLLKVLPKPGQMPPRDKTEGGAWTATVIATSEEAPGKRPVRVKAELQSKGDPGYWSTSRMLLEAGLCIALQEEELNASNTKRAGFLTPSVAFGDVLLKRLNKCNGMFSFKIVEG